MDDESNTMKDERICVLGVDDSPANLVALEAVLETLGITFVRAHSGQEALEHVLEKEFALILMDVQMPDMDGFETASLMRSNRKTEHIPIIFVTAINFQQKHVFKGYDTGAVDYLFKPFDPHILRSKARVFIDLFRQKEFLKHKAMELEKANRHILAQQRALKTSTMRFTTAFDQSFQFMAILDARGRVLELNALAKQLCDAAERKTIGEYLWDILRFGNGLHEAELSSLSAQTKLMPLRYNQSLKTIIEGAMAGAPTTDETVYYDKNKKMHSFMRTVSPVRDEYGEIVYIAVQGQDISERRRAQEEKQKLENQLRQAQKLEAIGTLAGGIAHDFNNILSIILGSAEMARRVSGGAEFDRYLDRILMAGNKAKDLIRQILIFSRQSEVKRVVFHPGTVVRESIRMLRSTLPSNIEIRQKIDNQCGRVLADPTQFHQILLNLCTNAFHAMEKSGGILTISLDSTVVDRAASHPGGETDPSGRYVRLTVGDTGTGISPENMARIFDPYFTTKEVGKGTGMGLSIIHGIVTGYGGFVDVASELSRGSTFFVHIPTADGPGVSEEPVDPPGSGGETILLIDDDEVILEMTRVMIEMLGYTVVSKKSSRDALELFRENPRGYDLVIINQNTAGVEGKEVSRQMLENRPELPVIICTSHGVPLVGPDCWEPGIADLAYKPLAIEDLSALIRNSLDKK